MSAIASIGIIPAFLAGLISFLSPCVLPLVPGYISYIAGRSLEELTDAPSRVVRLRALYLSACFVLGFSLVFIALGASASAVGQFLLANKTIFADVAGAIIILFGLYLTGLLKLPLLMREFRFLGGLRGGHPVSTALLGMAFAFGWTPCIGPILGAILTVSASSGSVAAGVLLLAIYSLGLGVPFLLAAGFTAVLLRRMGTIRKVSRPFQIFAGLILIVMGIALLTGYLNSFAFVLLNAFPGLAKLG
jgi:cytochrome c-type biogenesis protein